MSGAGTTIVTQTCPAPGHADAFAAWQNETSEIIAGFAGFVRQTVIPPCPPIQVDWVILQHFTDHASAIAWLQSDARQNRVAEVQPLVLGRDDVHIVAGDGGTGTAGPVSAVISTRIMPGQEQAYRRWELRIAAAQARAPGFQGSRLEPPVPGVQDDWLAIVRFDTDANLQAWLASPVRRALLEEASAFTDEYHTRIARTGFDQWFDVTSDAAAQPPVWRQNMLVLLLLYPVVFLFGTLVQTPWLIKRAGLAFPIALFIGNLVSIILLNYLVPWTSRRFRWWLQPGTNIRDPSGIGGAALVVALYGAMILVFTRLF
jgi:antibiotic biosynthesis monooxygenase (ABM) superfamily enzyme